MDIYRYAAQWEIRYPSVRGDLTTEQLFHLPLAGRNGFDLNSVAKAVNAELKANSEESFVSEEATNPKRRRLEVALDVVKDVIAFKQQQAAAARNRAARAAERQKLLDAISSKRDQALTSKTIEELEKQLAVIAAADNAEGYD